MIHPDFLDMVSRSAEQVAALRQYKGTLCATSYDPARHAVKGILVPEEVETGWIPVAALHTGNGFGIVAGPNAGNAKSLENGGEFDGDVFDVHFENGDPNTPRAMMKHFSAKDAPPEVKSGEMLLRHETGTRDKYAKDGSRTMTHAQGPTETWDAGGNLTTDAQTKTVTTKGGTIAEQAVTALAKKAPLIKNDTAKKIVTGAVHLAAGGTTV